MSSFSSSSFPSSTVIITIHLEMVHDPRRRDFIENRIEFNYRSPFKSNTCWRRDELFVTYGNGHDQNQCCSKRYRFLIFVTRALSRLGSLGNRILVSLERIVHGRRRFLQLPRMWQSRKRRKLLLDR